MNGWCTRAVDTPQRRARIKAMSAEDRRFWELLHQRRQAAGYPGRTRDRDLVTS